MRALFVVTAATVAMAATVAAVGCARPAPSPASPESAEPPASTAPSTMPPGSAGLTLRRVTWSELPGWQADRHAAAIPPLLRSCTRLARLRDDAPVGHDGHGGTARQWRHACARAKRLRAGDDAAARAFFEAEFVPHQAASGGSTTGKLTGYFVRQLRASRTKHGAYQWPILARPSDLVMIDLSSFIEDGHGRKIWGRNDGRGRIVPYYTRAEIRAGALDDQKLAIMYADDRLDVLFAQIQGTAKAIMDDGSVVWLGFAGKNGRTYRGVGKVLRGMDELEPGEASMQGIRRWFVAHPERFDEIVDQNESFVFFEARERAGAIGSQNVVLTPGRSLAIDRAFIAHSTPIWLDSRAPIAGAKGTAPWQRLVIAQDTGGGILGALRGDVFWGDDGAAGDIAGRMNEPARFWLLLPPGVTK